MSCTKKTYERLYDAQQAADELNRLYGQGKLHIYACQACPWTWHIGHKNSRPIASARTQAQRDADNRSKRRRRQREQTQLHRWDDDGGAQC